MTKPYIICDEQIPLAYPVFSRLGKVDLLPASEIQPVRIRSADVLVVRSVTSVDPALLNGTAVRVVGSVTSGLDHIDVGYLRERGLKLIGASGSNANSVAEYVISALLLFARHRGMTLKGMSVGIVGVGHVGSLVDEKCRALGMSTVWNDPPLARLSGDPKYRPLREIGQTDVITLHVPLNFQGPDATYHMINERFLEDIRRPFILINTARGKIVEEGSLVKFSRRRLFQGVIIDVWPNEPEVDLDLLDIADIATPHIAGYSLDGKVRAVDMVYKELCRLFKVREEETVMDRLDQPDDNVIKIEGPESNEMDVVGKAVLSVYDPRVDDQRFRKITGIDPAKRGQYFELLRQSYPVRREFDNYRVVFARDGDKTQKILKKLGFGC
jgi:erythronate-4-phosphate dehydrogenase